MPSSPYREAIPIPVSLSESGGDLERARSLAALALAHYEAGDHAASTKAVRRWLASTR